MARPGSRAIIPPKMTALKPAVYVVVTVLLVYTGVAGLLDQLGEDVPQTPVTVLVPALVLFVGIQAREREWL